VITTSRTTIYFNDNIIVGTQRRRLPLPLTWANVAECLAKKKNETAEKRCVQQSQSRDTVHDVNGRAGRYATEVARHTIARRVATAVVVGGVQTSVGEGRGRGEENAAPKKSTVPRSRRLLYSVVVVVEVVVVVVVVVSVSLCCRSLTVMYNC